MDLITALSVSIGALAALATYVFLGFMPGWQLWAAFIGWASYYAAGGKEAGLKASITSNIWGALLALIALMIINKSGMTASMGLPLTAAIVVGLTVAVLVFGAKHSALAAIPSSVLGYASVAALSLISGKLDALSEPTLANPFVAVLLPTINDNSSKIDAVVVSTATATVVEVAPSAGSISSSDCSR